jgi:hypothetical protein
MIDCRMIELLLLMTLLNSQDQIVTVTMIVIYLQGHALTIVLHCNNMFRYQIICNLFKKLHFRIYRLVVFSSFLNQISP